MIFARNHFRRRSNHSCPGACFIALGVSGLQSIARGENPIDAICRKRPSAWSSVSCGWPITFPDRTKPATSRATARRERIPIADISAGYELSARIAVRILLGSPANPANFDRRDVSPLLGKLLCALAVPGEGNADMNLIGLNVRPEHSGSRRRSKKNVFVFPWIGSSARLTREYSDQFHLHQPLNHLSLTLTP